MTLIQLFTAIANQIRRLKNKSGTIKAEDFPDEMAEIELGNLTDAEYEEADEDVDDILENTTVPTGTLSITANGEYDVTNYTDANVNVVSEYNAEVNASFTNNNSTLIKNIKKIPPIDCSNVSNLWSAFSNFSALEEVTLFNTDNVTNISDAFNNCTNLTEIAYFNTENVTNMNRAFQLCTSLITIPVLNTSKVEFFSSVFSACSNLSNESLNNIMEMCINATSWTGTKTLQYIGLSSTQVTTCQSLSNYQAFLNAGWTTGY